MTVEQLIKECGLKTVVLADGSREVTGAYIGDLLSWVMGRAQCDNVWITIMSNINVLAVASLSDVACVVFAEGVMPEQDIIDAINKNGKFVPPSLFDDTIKSRKGYISKGVKMGEGWLLTAEMIELIERDFSNIIFFLIFFKFYNNLFIISKTN